MSLARRLDCYPSSGTHIKSQLSILKFSDSEIKCRADRWGISLGKNKEHIASSVSVSKKTEHARTLIFLENNLNELQNEDSLVLQRASNLCEDLVDEEGEMLGDHAEIPTQKVKSVRKRRNNLHSQLKVRRSARIRKLSNV